MWWNPHGNFWKEALILLFSTVKIGWALSGVHTLRVVHRSMFCSEMQQQTTILKIFRGMKCRAGLKETIIDVSKAMVVVGSQYLKNHIPLTKSSQGLKWFRFSNGENNYSMSRSAIARRESWLKQAENLIQKITSTALKWGRGDILLTWGMQSLWWMMFSIAGLRFDGAVSLQTGKHVKSPWFKMWKRYFCNPYV